MEDKGCPCGWPSPTPALDLIQGPPQLQSFLHYAHEISHNKVTAPTRRRYLELFRQFFLFCHAHAVSFLPAEPTTVLAFIAYLSRSRQPTKIDPCCAAITFWHQAHGLAPPTEHRAVSHLRTATRRAHAKERVPREWRLPLRVQHLVQLREHLDLNDGWQLQLATLLHLGLRLGWRAANLAAISVHHLTWAETELRLFQPTSKTDPDFVGRYVAVEYPPGPFENFPWHPVALLRRHLQTNPATTGPIFRLWYRGEAITNTALSPRAVDALVKFAAYDCLHLTGRYSAHSLRIGAATAMAEAGIEDHVIMQQCGWSSSIFKSVYLRFARSTHGDITARMRLGV